MSFVKSYRRVSILVVSIALFGTYPSLAGQDLSWDIRPPTDERGPALVVTVGKPVEEFVLNLTRTGADGSKEEITLRPSLRPGRQNVVQLPQREGRSRWAGTVKVRFADGTEGRSPISFQTQWASAMRINESATPEQVKAGKLVLTATHPVKKAHVRITGEHGRLLHESDTDFGGASAGTPLEISWTPIEEDVYAVKLTLHSIYGVTADRSWAPWQVHIPHETVEFDTGSSVIREDQEHKLQGVLGELRDALSRYGTVAEVNLWIAGHTDTVGPRANNQRLSEARARSIGQWFRRAGLRVPISYRGFGQDSLLVRTADNVDEPRNRRAEYIVAADDPYEGRRDIPGSWQSLP